MKKLNNFFKSQTPLPHLPKPFSPLQTAPLKSKHNRRGINIFYYFLINYK